MDWEGDGRIVVMLRAQMQVLYEDVPVLIRSK